MFENLFKKKSAPKLINTHEADVVLRLMFEIAISDGSLDKAELDMIKKRANNIADTDEKLCRSLDVIKEKTLYGRKYMGVDRSTFIIDESGKILHSWRGVKVKGHVEEVLAKLKELK